MTKRDFVVKIAKEVGLTQNHVAVVIQKRLGQQDHLPLGEAKCEVDKPSPDNRLM